ncbi:MAG: cbb3-type cytochrome oxidase assembly protein CcoS [Kofleriaceae bacterium]
MGALYFILPLALIIATGAVTAFLWAVRSGQLDDLETPPRRILFEDVAASPPTSAIPPARRSARRP